MAFKAQKKVTGIISEVPECPVCMESMTPPIFQCESGHSLCNSCTKALSPPKCPICRQNMTQIRNLNLEDLIMKAKVACPNKPSGCVYTMSTMEVEDHIKECIFRRMECPLGLIFGKCSWNGYLKEMLDHFKERHPTNCNVTQDADVELKNVNLKEDDRFVYLAAQGKFLFILTVKIDTLKKMAYWCLQHIGSKKVAMQYIYEIHMSSKQDDRRKVVFSEHCFNDAIKAEEVFGLAKCPMLPLDALSHYIKDKKLSFRVFIKRSGPPPPKNKDNKPSNVAKGNNDAPNKAPFKPGPNKKNFNKNSN